LGKASEHWTDRKYRILMVKASINFKLPSLLQQSMSCVHK
jgi:hypothetical protein